MGTKDYAVAVTCILDPERKLFSDSVISRDECFDPHSKALRLKYVVCVCLCVCVCVCVGRTVVISVSAILILSTCVISNYMYSTSVC